MLEEPSEPNSSFLVQLVHPNTSLPPGSSWIYRLTGLWWKPEWLCKWASSLQQHDRVPKELLHSPQHLHKPQRLCPSHQSHSMASPITHFEKRCHFLAALSQIAAKLHVPAWEQEETATPSNSVPKMSPASAGSTLAVELGKSSSQSLNFWSGLDFHTGICQNLPKPAQITSNTKIHPRCKWASNESKSVKGANDRCSRLACSWRMLE